MKKLLLILLFIPLFGLSQDRVKFIASGLTCSMCSRAVHKSLESDKDIIKIETNLETQEWNIEYKEGTYTFDKLKSKVEGAGFGVEMVWLNGELIVDNKKKKK
jgi:copper chaperone CopZ